MFTDAAALAVSLVAIRIAKRVADRKRTFGYYRFEILAAAFNASLLFVVAGYILHEAYQRFFKGGRANMARSASSAVKRSSPMRHLWVFSLCWFWTK